MTSSATRTPRRLPPVVALVALASALGFVVVAQEVKIGVSWSEGNRESGDLNPCFPGKATDPWAGAADPGSSLKVALLGSATADELTERVATDLKAVEASCFGATFRPRGKIRRPEGAKAILYGTPADKTGRSVTLAYFEAQGKLYRFSLWCSSQGVRDVVFPVFRSHVSHVFSKEQEK